MCPRPDRPSVALGSDHDVAGVGGRRSVRRRGSKCSGRNGSVEEGCDILPEIRGLGTQHLHGLGGRLAQLSDIIVHPRERHSFSKATVRARPSACPSASASAAFRKLIGAHRTFSCGDGRWCARSRPCHKYACYNKIQGRISNTIANRSQSINSRCICRRE